MSVQSTIEATLAAMSPAERRVAVSIKANPSIVLTHTINDLAEVSQTSIATVVRFCHSIGLSGYSHLRLQLATELGMESAQFGLSMTTSDVRRDDSLSQTIEKISGLEKLAIDETVRSLELSRLDELAARIDRSPRVLCFGMGASHAVAQDLCDKLVRVGRNAQCPRDSYDAWMQAALVPSTAVAIGFSHGGTTPETIRFLRTARQQGGYTVAVTSVPSSPITRAADHVLRTVARDTGLRAGAMVSRIAQLCVVDILFLAVARRRYDETVKALQQTRRATRP